MNEEIENIEEIKKMLNFTTEGTSLRINNEVSKLLLKYIKELEQKESILDKVTEYCKRFEYETEPIGDDDYLTERALVCEDILEIIEGEKK